MIYLCIYHYRSYPHRGLRAVFQRSQTSLRRSWSVSAGQTKIIPNDSAACTMLSYRISIWPIRSTCTKSHGFSSSLILGGRCPQGVFLFLDYWHILHGLAYILLAWQGLSNNILLELFSQVYYHLIGWDRNDTAISHVCEEFKERILFYHWRLSWLRQELAWSTWSPIQYIRTELKCFPLVIFVVVLHT